MLRQLQIVYDSEPERAQELVRCKAANYVNVWDSESIHSHVDTLRKWHEPWQENASFEKKILDEAKGYQLEMKALKRQFKLKY